MYTCVYLGATYFSHILCKNNALNGRDIDYSKGAICSEKKFCFEEDAYCSVSIL